MIIAGTGHRPPKLGGYSPYVSKRLIDLASNALHTHQASTVISGMALGWDMALAEAAVNLGIPFHAYIPFVGQEMVWPMHSKLVYKALMQKAQHIVVCSEGGYTKAAMQVRNERMVNNCEMLLALWNGSNGGTANCLLYAIQKNKPYINLWSQFSNEKDEEESFHLPLEANSPDWLLS